MKTSTLAEPPAPSAARVAEQTALSVLMAISFSHLLNDTIQALIPSLYPLFKQNMSLSYSQLGLITLTFQCTASLLQPLVGRYTDRRPMPYSLAVGMGITLLGLLLLSVSHTFPMVVLSAGMVGMGSAVFHPEASRVAHMASGGKRGFAQSLFQVGGNAGSSLGPLLAAAIIVPHGQGATAWFSVLAGVGMLVLWQIGGWMSRRLHETKRKSKHADFAVALPFPKATVIRALLVLVALIFSKYVYLTSMTSYYTLYLIHRFGVSVQASQIYLFVFLFAVALGTIIGGPIGDRIGRKKVIWVSILGVAPFTLWLPHAGLTATMLLTIAIGLILASAFSAILVYAQELVPGKVGQIAGLFFGLAFGIAGIGSAVLGRVADSVGIETVYHFCAYLPLIGLLTILLPDVETGND
ncbi:major facilitator superfamily MFS_1 [Chthoniobacter flavus Ellin428]|uniref:Major facilitator superfamily MFS_1 n=1 Tax=Chthoniobacter flavus Ellin428 TaxID=497964 RepID=B4D4M6_9BACT|nr:MFS transporter [Chthoniobacter flavus]EDY18479.1 major facilitator superfamily MFS_1 [Chthoniobacter flavus Ellin428]TCO91058.1 FSR family fosmidomycin resistance protein-like MFS transporter [Chthoniobacter flavus]